MTWDHLPSVIESRLYCARQAIYHLKRTGLGAVPLALDVLKRCPHGEIHAELRAALVEMGVLR